jgi:hypothetical protein
MRRMIQGMDYGLTGGQGRPWVGWCAKRGRPRCGGLFLFAKERWEVEVLAVDDGGVRTFEAAAGGGVEGEFGLWAGAFDSEFEFGGFGCFGGGLWGGSGLRLGFRLGVFGEFRCGFSPEWFFGWAAARWEGEAAAGGKVGFGFGFEFRSWGGSGFRFRFRLGLGFWLRLGFWFGLGLGLGLGLRFRFGCWVRLGFWLKLGSGVARCAGFGFGEGAVVIAEEGGGDGGGCGGFSDAAWFGEGGREV